MPGKFLGEFCKKIQKTHRKMLDGIGGSVVGENYNGCRDVCSPDLFF